MGLQGRHSIRVLLGLRGSTSERTDAQLVFLLSFSKLKMGATCLLDEKQMLLCEVRVLGSPSLEAEVKF